MSAYRGRPEVVGTQTERRDGPICDIGPDEHPTPRLGQARTAKPLQIVIEIGVQFDRHLARDPGERNIGLRGLFGMKAKGSP